MKHSKHIIGKYCERHNITLTAFAEGVEVNLPTVYRWLQGLHMPNSTHLKKVKKFTKGEITPNDFIGDM